MIMEAEKLFLLLIFLIAEANKAKQTQLNTKHQFNVVYGTFFFGCIERKREDRTREEKFGGGGEREAGGCE